MYSILFGQAATVVLFKAKIRVATVNAFMTVGFSHARGN
jgi:hypothetical protein